MDTKNCMPIFFYPTHVVLIDDNPEFLHALERQLKHHHIPTLSFTDARESLMYLNTIDTQNPLMTALSEEACSLYEDSKPDSTILEIIQSMMRNPHRHSTISVVIADYNMPDMTGDILLSAFKHPYIKKMMLTGYAEYELAVDLFNQHVVNSFIMKDLSSASEALPSKILALQADYFTALSASIAETFFITHPYILESDYADFVKNLISQHQITEHYTYAKNGSKCLRSAEGKIFHLVLATSEEMQGFAQTAELANAPCSIIEPIQQRTHMPALFTSDAINLSPTEWTPHLTPIQEIVLNGHTVYWALLEA